MKITQCSSQFNDSKITRFGQVLIFKLCLKCSPWSFDSQNEHTISNYECSSPTFPHIFEFFCFLHQKKEKLLEMNAGASSPKRMNRSMTKTSPFSMITELDIRHKIKPCGDRTFTLIMCIIKFVVMSENLIFEIFGLNFIFDHNYIFQVFFLISHVFNFSITYYCNIRLHVQFFLITHYDSFQLHVLHFWLHIRIIFNHVYY